MNLQFINPFFKNKNKNIVYETLIPPVFDRTQKDVDKAIEYIKRGYQNLTEKEKNEWLNGLKGCLNYEDVNRIEENIRILGKVLGLDIITKQYLPTDVPNELDYKRIIDNVNLIRNTYMVHADTPETPDLPIYHYSKVNYIEKIILDIYEILCSNFSYYTGEIYSGDQIGAIL